jgi:hypothetical protein
MGWLETVKRPSKGVSSSRITNIAEVIEIPQSKMMVYVNPLRGAFRPKLPNTMASQNTNTT